MSDSFNYERVSDIILDEKFLNTVYVVAVFSNDWIPGNPYYFAAQTDVGINLNTEVTRATIFSNKDDANEFAEEVQDKTGSLVFVFGTSRIIFGSCPIQGVR